VQFTVLSRWGAAPEAQDAPIRWLLLDFQFALAPGQEAYVFLQEGGASGTGAHDLQVAEDSQAVWVDTGIARFRIDKTTGDLTEEGTAVHLTGRAVGVDGEMFSATTVHAVQVNLAGPLRASVEVHGGFSSGGQTLLDYTARYWFYAGRELVPGRHNVQSWFVFGPLS